ncbi:MAG: MotA/TolQ/ExbB proton channel family protein [Flavobacteriaceae bacterium]|nr:MotA/TolQ/ExbB proton channel family protein [Flavobacteriaceae bacterium]
MIPFYFQDPAPLQTEKTLSLLELIKNGGLGGQVIIGLLFVLLLIVTYIYFERLFAILSAVKVTPSFMPQIRSFVMNGKLEGARQLCVQENVPVARLISKGLSRIGRPLDDINSAIENAGRLEVYQLEKNISILATISGAAPMLGFLGTVIGMILSIFEISNAGGNIDMQLLADGLYTAMTTTVAGLIVGILGYICYNHLVVKINKAVYQMEASSLEFLDLLNEPA